MRSISLLHLSRTGGRPSGAEARSPWLPEKRKKKVPTSVAGIDYIQHKELLLKTATSLSRYRLLLFRSSTGTWKFSMTAWLLGWWFERSRGPLLPAAPVWCGNAPLHRSWYYATLIISMPPNVINCCIYLWGHNHHKEEPKSVETIKSMGSWQQARRKFNVHWLTLEYI